MEPPFTHDIDEIFTKIVEVFAELGYPQDLIAQWTLPQCDARTIAGIIKECQPHNILEVGTFVGLTTLLMALITPEDTHIHTIDPNLPLMVEMEAMKSRMYDSDTAIRTQDLALQAADVLRVKNKITFHAGGFSTSNTFASYNASPYSQAQIIGPDVCKHYGPFDFIFIDGLHYEKDVFSDVSLAAEHLSPSGLIALHDVLGSWGSNVRRGIFRFLEQHDDFHFSHGSYSDINNSIGLLERYSRDGVYSFKKDNLDLKDKGLIQDAIIPNLGSILIDMFSPANAIQIGNNISILEQLKNYGVSEVCVLTHDAQKIQHDSIPIQQFDFYDKYHFQKKYDLCLCLDITNSFPPELYDNAIQFCVEASNTVIFACTPPGEMGYYQLNDKPLIYWIKKFFEKGYIFYDAIRPILEPLNYSETLYPGYKYQSSYLMNFYIAKKDDNVAKNIITKAKLEEIVINKERRIEDLCMQNLYKTNVIKFYSMIVESNKIICQELYEEINNLNEINNNINMFNHKVIRNTIKVLFNKIQKIFLK